MQKASFFEIIREIIVFKSILVKWGLTRGLWRHENYPKIFFRNLLVNTSQMRGHSTTFVLITIFSKKLNYDVTMTSFPVLLTRSGRSTMGFHNQWPILNQYLKSNCARIEGYTGLLWGTRLKVQKVETGMKADLIFISF